MHRRTLATLSLIIILPLCAAQSRAEVATSQDFQRICEAYYKLDLDAGRAHDVSNAVIVRDISTIRLTKGVLVFSEAIEGVTPIAVFLGEGSLTATPVRKMDRNMLSLAAKDVRGTDIGEVLNTNI